MRLLLLALFISISSAFIAQSGFHQKVDEKLQYLDLSGLETGILYDRTYPVAKLFDESYGDKVMDSRFFIQSYSELHEADFQARFQSISALKSLAQSEEGIVSIGLLHTGIERVTKEAMISGHVYVDVDGYVKRTNLDASPFERTEVTVVSPLQKYHKGLSVDFALNPAYFIELTDTYVTSVSMDFGNSLVALPMDGGAIHKEFKEAGKQEFTFIIEFSDGQLITRTSSILLKEEQVVEDFEHASMRYPGQETPILTVNAKIPFQGYTETAAIKGQGQAKAYLDNVDGVFDKPIILIDGFDPGDSRGIEDIYSLLDFGDTGANLADVVRDEGYDVVLLNFPTYTKNAVTIDGGADYIQRNAMVLVEAIKKVNARKVGNEELVVIGPSMGGLIARYALRYMETQGMNHETRLYVSFDSPHFGANIPIGAQYLINYYGYEYGDQATQDLVNQALRSAAAKQMLLDHVDGHLANNSNVEQNPSLKLPAGSPGFRSVFQSELDALGFPQNCRNVSLVNGSGTGVGIESANALALNTTFDIALSVSADATVRYTPAAGNTNTICTLDGYILWFIPVFSFSATSQAYAYTDGYDSAPGGTTDIASTISSFGESGALIDPNDLLVDNFSFIPVYSSLAISGNVDQHAAVNPADVTAFDAYYAPSQNEDHVTLTDGNVAFVLDEIGGLVGSGIHMSDIALFELRSNVVKEKILLDILPVSSNEPYQMQILSIDGKKVYEERWMHYSPVRELPVNLSAGVYIIQMNKGSSQESKKFIVE